MLETEGESAVYLSEGSEPQLAETVFTAGYPAVDRGELKYHHSISNIKIGMTFFTQFILILKMEKEPVAALF